MIEPVFVYVAGERGRYRMARAAAHQLTEGVFPARPISAEHEQLAYHNPAPFPGAPYYETREWRKVKLHFLANIVKVVPAE